MTLPYASATSGGAAREEVVRLLQRVGASSVGFMDEFETHTLILAFTWRDRRIQMRASAQGWAAAYLRENPWTSRHKKTKTAHEAAALAQGKIAINSILRDWVKGQITAIETGIMTFDHAFLPHAITQDGRQGIEVLRQTLALPDLSEN